MVHLPKPEDLQQKTKPKQTHSWTHSTNQSAINTVSKTDTYLRDNQIT